MQADLGLHCLPTESLDTIVYTDKYLEKALVNVYGQILREGPGKIMGIFRVIRTFAVSIWHNHNDPFLSLALLFSEL